MRSVIQRVIQAEVTVDGLTVGRIDKGLLVYLGIAKGDTERQLEWMCNKIAKLRMFADEMGKMNKCLYDGMGSILVVSQFTLLANLNKGNRPSYDDAADPSDAKVLYERSLSLFKDLGLEVAHGEFGAHMHVSYINDGPVTMVLDR